MKKLIYLSAISAFLMTSCGTSHDVVDSGLFQKRKYNKGYHISKKSKTTKTVKEDQDEIVWTNSSEEVNMKSELEINTVEANNYSEVKSTDAKEVTNPTVITTSKKSGNTKNGITISKINRTSNKSGLSSMIFAHPVSKENRNDVSDRDNTSSDTMTIILVILAIFIPPLAVFLYEDASTRFWIDLILALVGWGVGWYLLGGLAWVCGIVAIIYALLIVLGAI